MQILFAFFRYLVFVKKTSKSKPNGLLLMILLHCQETSTESTSRTISVSIDYSEIQSLNDVYDDEIKNWQNQLADKDKIINELKAKIAKLEAEIKSKNERY